ncbi:hypothetical protein [Capnocytophaga ochracea]|jgi:hypothetical protein
MIINNFLNRLELFYRNFGDEWKISDFSANRNTQKILKEYLITLEVKGIIKFIDDNKFKIINLPSKYKD